MDDEIEGVRGGQGREPSDLVESCRAIEGALLALLIGCALWALIWVLA